MDIEVRQEEVRVEVQVVDHFEHLKEGRITSSISLTSLEGTLSGQEVDWREET